MANQTAHEKGWQTAVHQWLMAEIPDVDTGAEAVAWIRENHPGESEEFYAGCLEGLATEFDLELA